MFNKILVPVDCSDVAECVLPHVKAITSGKNPVDITFLCVVKSLDKPMADSKYKEHIELEAKFAAEDYMKKLISGLSYKKSVHGEVIVGKVASSILEYSIKNNIDLILLSSHGQSGIGPWVRGSIADKILHESKIPVLRIRASAPQVPIYTEGQKMTVLVPLDGSELAEVKLNYVRELVNHFGTESVDIVLLRVCELFPYPPHYPPPMPLSWKEYLKYETKRCTDICQAYLTEVKEELEKEGLNVRLEVPIGNPAEAIVEYVKKNAVHLLVLSTHGHGGLSQWAFGNVANKVMKGTSIPTLLIRSTHDH